MKNQNMKFVLTALVLTSTVASARPYGHLAERARSAAGDDDQAQHFKIDCTRTISQKDDSSGDDDDSSKIHSIGKMIAFADGSYQKRIQSQFNSTDNAVCVSYDYESTPRRRYGQEVSDLDVLQTNCNSDDVKGEIEQTVTRSQPQTDSRTGETIYFTNTISTETTNGGEREISRVRAEVRESADENGVVTVKTSKYPYQDNSVFPGRQIESDDEVCVITPDNGKPESQPDSAQPSTPAPAAQPNAPGGPSQPVVPAPQSPAPAVSGARSIEMKAIPAIVKTGDGASSDVNQK